MSSHCIASGFPNTVIQLTRVRWTLVRLRFNRMLQLSNKALAPCKPSVWEKHCYIDGQQSRASVSSRLQLIAMWWIISCRWFCGLPHCHYDNPLKPKVWLIPDLKWGQELALPQSPGTKACVADQTCPKNDWRAPKWLKCPKIIEMSQNDWNSPKMTEIPQKWLKFPEIRWNAQK